jgi:4-amino-4-deoxy-L-arabinose transferase-like glycosyltransferase
VVLALSLVLLLAGALRFYGLGGEPIWLDEAISIVEAHGSVSDILTVVPLKDFNPPLYFLVLKGWMGLAGDSAAAVRVPSAAFGLAAVAILFLLGLELRGAALGLVVAFLAAISYFLILYSQEARMYSLLVLLSSISYYFFFRIVCRGETGRASVGYAASTALLLYTHYHAPFLVLAQLLTAACFWRRLAKVRLRLFASLAVAALAFSPWLPTLWSQVQIVSGRSWWILKPTIRSLGVVNCLWVANPFLYYTGKRVIPPCLLPLLFFLVLAFMGCYTWARAPAPASGAPRLRPIGWAPAEETILLAFWMLVPMLVPFALSQTGPSIFWPRYMIGAVPAFYLLVARGMVALNRRWLTFGLCLVILVLSIPGLLRYYRLPQKEQWDQVARLVEQEGMPGDLVVLAPRYIATPFNYYYRGALDRLGISDSEATAEIAKQLEAAMVGRSRIWLINSHRKRAYRAIRDLIHTDPVDQHVFLKVEVLLYEVQPEARFQ